MEEERVRKLKTLTEVRKEDFERASRESLDFLRGFREKISAGLSDTEWIVWDNELMSHFANVDKSARTLIRMYGEYVKALEKGIPKPDWEIP